MANVLDMVLLVFFGGWAYLMAKRKFRDEVGWAIVAAVAFFLPGYAMQEAIFPALAKSYGWSEAVQGTWQKPAGFILGGLCALIVDLVLTFAVKPLPEPEKSEKSDEPPSGAGGGGSAGSAASGGEPTDGSAGQPPSAQQMAVADGGAVAAPLDPQVLFARFWPVLVPVALFALALIPALGNAVFGKVPENPADDPRYFLLPLVFGVLFWRLRGRPLEGVLAAVFALMYVPAMAWMQWRWGRGSSYYSHGYLIPVVVTWLVWLNRGRLAALRAHDDLRWAGLVVLGGGLVLLLAGTFMRTYSIQGVSLVITLCGTVFFLFGKAITRVLWFPLFFTITMVPMPMHMVERITFKLKMFAAAGSVWVVDALRVVGLHSYLVVQDGSYIRWETANLDMDFIIIGDVCSGLRSLIALLAFGALFAYLAKMSMLRKLILFAAAVPISVLANMWRIVTLAFIACKWGSEATHGFVHDATGYGIFAVAFVLFFGFERLLRSFGGETGGQPPEATHAAQPPDPA